MLRRVLGVSHPRGRGKSRGSKGVKRDVGGVPPGVSQRVKGNVRGDQGGSGGRPGVPGGQEGCPRVQGKCRGSKGVPKLPLFSLKYVCTNSQKTNHLNHFENWSEISCLPSHFAFSNFHVFHSIQLHKEYR